MESGLGPIGNSIIIIFPDSIETSKSLCYLVPIEESFKNVNCGISYQSNYVYVDTTFALMAGAWYKLRITLTNQLTQTAGYKGVIQMYSASSKNKGEQIIYDLSTNAGTFQIAPAPNTETKVAFSYDSSVRASDQNSLGQTNIVNFDITPQLDVPGGSIWSIVLSSSSYSFVGSCTSATQLCPSSNSSCSSIVHLIGSYIVSKDKITFSAIQDVLKNRTFRIKGFLRNPSFMEAKAGITVTSVSKISNLIFETVTLANIFSVSQITVGNPSIYYLWGISSIDSTKTLCPLGFFATPTGSLNKIFNPFRVTFTGADTPSGQNLEVSKTKKNFRLINYIFHYHYSIIPTIFGN